MDQNLQKQTFSVASDSRGGEAVPKRSVGMERQRNPE